MGLCEFGASLVYPGEFQDSLGYIVRSYLEKKKVARKNNNNVATGL